LSLILSGNVFQITYFCSAATIIKIKSDDESEGKEW